VGVASYLKENKISSLAFIFVHSSALVDAPFMLGPALGISSRPLIAFYGISRLIAQPPSLIKNQRIPTLAIPI